MRTEEDDDRKIAEIEARLPGTNPAQLLEDVSTLLGIIRNLKLDLKAAEMKAASRGRALLAELRKS